MFKKKSSEPSKLEEAIDTLFEEMAGQHGYDPDYAKMVTQMDTLYKLKEVDAKIDTGKRVSRDTWAIVIGNLAGILIIVGHERAHVVTSKALNFMMKLR
jgi:hypothetical protein